MREQTGASREQPVSTSSRSAQVRDLTGAGLDADEIAPTVREVERERREGVVEVLQAAGRSVAAGAVAQATSA